MDKKVLAFSHIPKNAGSFVTYLLRSYYGTSHCRAFSRQDVYGYEDLKKDFRIYPNLKAISGHPLRPFVDFKEYEQYLVWALIIRDPYARFPSQYHWWCKQNGSNLSFDEWCRLKGEKFSDFQCRWIAGVADHKSALEVISLKKVIIGFQSDIGGFMSKLVKTLNVERFPWNDKLQINSGGASTRTYSKTLIEKYNLEDILLYNQLMSIEDDQPVMLDSWTRPLNFSDRVNYHLNLLKHVAVYKPFKRLV